MITAMATAALLCAAQGQDGVEELRRRHEQLVRELEQVRRRLAELEGRRPGGEGEGLRPKPEGEGRPRPPQERPQAGGVRPPQPPFRCRCEMKCQDCHPPRPPQGERPPREGEEPRREGRPRD
jgi:hypothetical protein